MKPVRDEKGQWISPLVQKESDGTWGVNVWLTGITGAFTLEVRRYYYQTREQARNGRIQDLLGQNGRVR